MKSDSIDINKLDRSVLSKGEEVTIQGQLPFVLVHFSNPENPKSMDYSKSFEYHVPIKVTGKNKFTWHVREP